MGKVSRYCGLIPPARAPCRVPGCDRTVKTADLPLHYNEFFCSTHWRTVPALLKRLKRRHEREFGRCGFYPRDEAYRRLMRRIRRVMECV